MMLQQNFCCGRLETWSSNLSFAEASLHSTCWPGPILLVARDLSFSTLAHAHVALRQKRPYNESGGHYPAAKTQRTGRGLHAPYTRESFACRASYGGAPSPGASYSGGIFREERGLIGGHTLTEVKGVS